MTNWAKWIECSRLAKISLYRIIIMTVTVAAQLFTEVKLEKWIASNFSYYSWWTYLRENDMFKSTFLKNSEAFQSFPFARHKWNKGSLVSLMGAKIEELPYEPYVHSTNSRLHHIMEVRKFIYPREYIARACDLSI